MFAGCVALSIAGTMLCYSGDRITCIDQPVVGISSNIHSCKTQSTNLNQQMEWCKKNGFMSADGSTSTCVFPYAGTTQR